MCEGCNENDLRERIYSSIAAGREVTSILSALESRGYVVMDEPIYGIGIGFQSGNAQVMFYFPVLTVENNKAADL